MVNPGLLYYTLGYLSMATVYLFSLTMNSSPRILGTSKHRRRMNTEEKSNVVAAVWWTQFIQFLAYPILQNRPSAINPIHQFILVQNR